MQRKYRLGLFWVGIGALALILIIGILYSYLAFMPTGFDQFRKEAAAAQERRNKRIASLNPAATDQKTSAPLGQIPTQKGPGPAHPLDFFEEFATFGNYSNLCSGKIDQNYIGGGIPDRSDQMFYFCPLTRSVAQCYGNLRVDQTPPASRPIWPDLDAGLKADLMHQIHYGFRRNTITTPTAEKTEFLHRYLDKYERFLLRPRWDVPETTSPAVFDAMLTARLTLLAIARASLRGDQQHALSILDRYMELARIFRMHRRYLDTESIFWGLSELPDFPAEGFERARRAVESMRLSDDDIADMRSLEIRKWHEHLTGPLISGNFNTRGNTWHFLYGGRMESIANRALLPVALRKAEQMALSLEKGDDAAFGREQSEWEKIVGLMNSRSSWILDDYVRSFEGMTHQTIHGRLSEINCMNAEIDYGLLVLDMARARHDGDANPAGATKYGIRVEMFTVPRFGLFINLPNTKEIPPEMNPLMDALDHRKFPLGKYGEWPPTDPAEIEEVIKAAGPGDWGRFVEYFDEREGWLTWTTRWTWSAKEKKMTDSIRVGGFVMSGPILSEGVKKCLR